MRRYLSKVMRYIYYESGYDFNPAATSNRSIRHASCLGLYPIVSMLLDDKRVDPSDIQNEAIMGACKNGHVEVVRLLLASNRLNFDRYINYALMTACRYGRTDVVRLLLKDDRIDPAFNNSIALRVICGDVMYEHPLATEEAIVDIVRIYWRTDDPIRARTKTRLSSARVKTG